MSDAQRKDRLLNNIDQDTSGDAVVRRYLQEISRIPLLSREREEELARKTKEGDTGAKDLLLRSNLRFVVSIAKKYQNMGLPLADLISEGTVGLINAIERFDVDKGYHFISYAVWWIQQAILKALSQQTRAIRLPMNRAGELFRIQRKKDELQKERGREPEVEEIADSLNLEPRVVKNLLSLSSELVSLNATAGDERDSASLIDYLEDPNGKNPESAAIEQSLADEIDRALQTLSEKEAEVIRLRFGLNGRKPSSLKEIGARYKVTKERVRQIEARALKKLQDPARAGRLRSFVVRHGEEEE
jgi:RNA polymerase primary sigma factor